MATTKEDFYFLNTEEKYVSHVYERFDRSGGGVSFSSTPVYNPLDVDNYGEGISLQFFEDRVESGRYEISKDKERLIQECDKLIDQMKELRRIELA